MNTLYRSFLLITVLFNLHLIESSVEKVSVTIKAKQFNGITKVIDGKEVNTYLGIPYAKPPIGELRFKKPVPLNNYDKPIDATQWPNPCMQRIIPEQLFLYHNKNFSEDCLYLNIWSTDDSSNEINDESQQILKPVLFWIHGGGLMVGSSNMVITSGEMLALRGNVVVVSINYRLGYFGFLYSGTDDAPGNLGLWDQALAMKWVNDNIEHFGGDPQRITIFGAGNGGLCVSLHLVSPITRHLFKNAVIMSGSIHPIFIMETQQALNTSLNIAKSLSCDRDSVDKTFNCLRSVSANNFTSMTFNLKSLLKHRIMAYIYGDDFLPANPKYLMQNTYYRKRNILFGNTYDEGSVLLNTFYDNITYAERNPRNITKSESKIELKNILSLLGVKDGISEDVYRLYISQLPEHNYDLIRRSIGQAIGDYMVSCPIIGFSRILFRNSVDNLKIYQYLFNGPKLSNSWHYSDHYSDVIYWFGNVPQNNLSLRMVGILSNFARNGNPGPQQGIEWRPHLRRDLRFAVNELITPYYEITDEPNINEGNYGLGYKYQCNFYNSLGHAL